MTREQLEVREQGFEKRYGKKVSLTGDSLISDNNELLDYRLTFKTPKGEYTIKEHLKDGLTDFVLLQYKKDDREFNHKYNRFIDAEISVADKISEE